MIIKKFTIKESSSVSNKTINFSDAVNLIYSSGNSTGKTTLIRSLLYAMGFQIPSTELIDFEDYEFWLTMSDDSGDIEIYRSSSLLKVNNEEFDLPVDQKLAHSKLFGIQNNELLENFLGVHYFDQEKGWTLLNRGVIIGKNRFGVERFFRGLKEDESQESYELDAQLKATNKKIAQYKLMLNIAEYQETLGSDFNSNFDYDSFEQDQNVLLMSLKFDLNEVNSEISLLDSIIKGNNAFSKFIESKDIYVTPPNGGEPFKVTKDSLFNFEDNSELNQTRKNMLVLKRNAIKSEIAKIESNVEKQMTFNSIATADDELTKKLANIQGLSAVQINSMISGFVKQRDQIKRNLTTRTKTDNPWVNRAYYLLTKYCNELGIPDGYKLDIFTTKLKGKSGSILHKLVFIYKLVYIQVLREKTGIVYPIICDSPSGREVEINTVEQMLQILIRDFSEHQIIIASINKFENELVNPNEINMDGTFFDPVTLVS